MHFFQSEDRDFVGLFVGFFVVGLMFSLEETS